MPILSLKKEDVETNAANGQRVDLSNELNKPATKNATVHMEFKPDDQLHAFTNLFGIQ